VATNDVVSVVANADATSVPTSVPTSVEEDDTILRTWAAKAKSLADYREAVKRSQAATQTANLAKDVQQRDDRQQARERQQRKKQERYMKATGRWPT
jgi:tmRNA-binding protein